MKKISLSSLVLLIIAAIDSIRNLPASSLFGTQLIFFFIFAAVVFLVPVALVSAELAAKDGLKGGIYQWILKAFGHKWAMVAIWLQWINTVVWYPTILSFIAGTLAYLIRPSLASNVYFLMPITMAIFWFVTVINLKGIRFTARVNSLSVLAGTLIPMILLIILGFIWVVTGYPLEITFNNNNLLPSFQSPNNWVSLVAIMASLTGIELSGVHIKDMEDPQTNFPKAVFISSFFIFITMLLGSLSIAIVVPKNEISLVAGVMQVIDNFFSHFNLDSLTPIAALLIFLGSTGGIMNWVLSPAKGLVEAAELGYLPPHFLKHNEHGVPHNILIIQAVVVTVICALFMVIPSINSFYWFLTALSTELYMFMYVLMFFAAYKLRNARETARKTFIIPGDNVVRMGVVTLGLTGCLITIFISFFPPETLKIESLLSYISYIGLGNILSLAPLGLFFYHKKKSSGYY